MYLNLILHRLSKISIHVLGILNYFKQRQQSQIYDTIIMKTLICTWLHPIQLMILYLIFLRIVVVSQPVNIKKTLVESWIFCCSIDLSQSERLESLSPNQFGYAKALVWSSCSVFPIRSLKKPYWIILVVKWTLWQLMYFCMCVLYAVPNK